VRDPRARGGTGIRDLISRRNFLIAAAGTALWPLARPASAAAHRAFAAAGSGVSAELAAVLESSPYVYVSPLRADGSESTCHGEVWFAWLDGSVVLTSAATTWKARAVARDLEKARVWVGDHGRWKTALGRNEGFRAAPSFVARASVVKDEALLERLLAVYEKKYPAEIGRWRDRMRAGNADGSRVLLRYAPEAGTRT
jgi:hypothetical protein